MLPKVFLAGLAAILGVGVGRGAYSISNTDVKGTEIRAESAAPQPQVQPAVRLMLYASPVWVFPPGAAEKTEAVNGQELAVGTRVVTSENTRAAIVYPNGTTTVLDFSTEVILKEFQASPQKVVVTLDKNRIWSRVVKLLGEESYQTESSTVVATVRGTSYGHSVTAKGNKIITSEGLVVGNCKEAGQNGEIPVGHTTDLTCANDKTVPPKPITTKDKDEWFEFNAEEDKIEALLRDKESFDQAASAQTQQPSGSGLVLTPTPTPRTVSGQRSAGTTNATNSNRTASGVQGVTAPTPTPTPVPTPIPLPPGEVFADSVVSLSGTFGNCCGAPTGDMGEAQRLVTGPPDTNQAEGANNFIQLSDNSVITIRFGNNRAVDRPGADIRIYNVDELYPGTAKFEVGQGPDCGSTGYRDMGSYSDTGRVELDISGMTFVHCIRITDLADAGDPFPQLGFDIDAVEAINSEEVK